MACYKNSKRRVEGVVAHNFWVLEDEDIVEINDLKKAYELELVYLFHRFLMKLYPRSFEF
jgi:hypothetical protein